MRRTIKVSKPRRLGFDQPECPEETYGPQLAGDRDPYHIGPYDHEPLADKHEMPSHVDLLFLTSCACDDHLKCMQPSKTYIPDSPGSTIYALKGLVGAALIIFTNQVVRILS